MLHIDGVQFSYKGINAPRFEFNLTLNTGEIGVVEAASGMGKSTLLHLIAGFLPPRAGIITWHGQSLVDLPPAERPLSMIFQDSNLFEHLSCRENIGLGLDPSLRLTQAQWQMVDASLDRLGIADIALRRPLETSGGQQQRVTLARALCRAQGQQRQLLLFDEPFSALDPSTRQDCIASVREVMSTPGMTALMVSHDPADAAALKARVFRL